MKTLIQRKKGFTLIEVMISISIFLFFLYLIPIFSGKIMTQNVSGKELQTYEGKFSVIQIGNDKFIEMPNKRIKIDKLDFNIKDIPVGNYIANKGVIHLDNETKKSYITIFQ